MHSIAPLGKYLSTISTFEIVPIFIGHRSQELALNLHQAIPTTLYVPFLQSPYRYVWPIKGREIKIVDTGKSSKDFIKLCATCFYGHGALDVTYISKQSTFIIKRI